MDIRQEKIIQFLKEASSMNISDILTHLKNDVALRTVNRDLSALKKLGLIERQGGGRGTLWKLKTK